MRHGRSDQAGRRGHSMKDVRCLVGVHDWSTDMPESVHTRTGGVTLVCRRCGRLKRHADVRRDLNSALPPEAYGGGG